MPNHAAMQVVGALVDARAVPGDGTWAHAQAVYKHPMFQAEGTVGRGEDTYPVYFFRDGTYVEYLPYTGWRPGSGAEVTLMRKQTARYDAEQWLWLFSRPETTESEHPR